MKQKMLKNLYKLLIWPAGISALLWVPLDIPLWVPPTLFAAALLAAWRQRQIKEAQ